MNARVDIVVVGSGAAGIAAAIGAARAGCRTLLFDSRDAAGGTGGFSGLTTLCGLFDDQVQFLNQGFAREFAEAIAADPPRQAGKVWLLPYRPEKFRAAAVGLLSATPNVQTQWNTPLADVVSEQGRIVSVNGIAVGAVIDCTGSAEVARALKLDCLATDEATQSSAIIFPLYNVSREMNSPADAAQVLLPLARAGLPSLNFQPGPEPHTLTAKFSGRADQVRTAIEFLRKNVSGFEQCETPQTEFAVARRAGRMIPGQYLLTGTDVLAGRKFSDGIAACAWPIEQWNKNGAVRFRYLPTGTHYQIPARCLRAAKVENLFMAGKTISADIDAIASARVMGCCLATGEAAGKLAAAHVKTNVLSGGAR